jgi:hypothetical protein
VNSCNYPEATREKGDPMTGTRLSFEQILELAERQYEAYLRHPVFGPLLQERPSGGYLCVVRKDGSVRKASVSTYTDDDKKRRNELFCGEKAKRLGAHPEHVLSWQSRDPDNDMYGGAVRGDEDTWSYSGDPEDLDWLKMLALAVKAGDMTRERMTQILDQFPNKYYKMLQDAGRQDPIGELLDF